MPGQAGERRTAAPLLPLRDALSSELRRLHVDARLRFDEAPNAVFEISERLAALHRERAGPLDLDLHVGQDPAGPRAHDDDAVGQIEGLVDLVRDEEDGLACLAPD